MLTRFNEFVSENRLFNSGQKILLAVSGGMDSMVLWDLFNRTQFKYSIVHCNFQLRGADSDHDEAFVKQQAVMHGVKLFTRHFDTEEYARLEGISIEMAARELRYRYFEKVRAENHFDFIATAHHLDDVLETFFLNLSRKTGIKGLTGIKEKSGKVIRPLLFASRDEIREYARKHSVDYRDDITNHQVVYQRNFIRHRILPLFSELNPAFRKNLMSTIGNLKEAGRVYDAAVEQAKDEVMVEEEKGKAVIISKLLELPYPEVLLHEILSEYNFNPAIAGQVFQSLDTISGKQFFSATHRLLKDREKLFFMPLSGEQEQVFYIETGDIEIFVPFGLSIEKLSREHFQMVSDPHVACLDQEKLEFPLLIRKWRQGDYFQPLGMTGFKKLSDFFIDEKVPVHEKENTWLLCSGRNIVWVMGRRIDNRFKITPETRKILKIEIDHLK